MNKQCFLLLTDFINDKIYEKYYNIKLATQNLGDAFILFHNKTEQLVSSEVFEFTDSVLHELNYNPICENVLIPGSNHFPLLKFYLDNPEYSHYWLIENDVEFTGDWNKLFEYVKNIEYDFISSFVGTYEEKTNKDWLWWKAVVSPENIHKQYLTASFNPIYSLSNKASSILHEALQNGWKGHHEVIMATLFKSKNLIIKDFGKKFYTDKTHLYRPIFKQAGELKNKIYHPVKIKK